MLDSDDSLADGMGSRGRPGANPYLAEDVGDVGGNGTLADEQRVGNLSVRTPLGDQAEDIDLAGGQPFYFARTPRLAGDRSLCRGDHHRERFGNGLFKRQALACRHGRRKRLFAELGLGEGQVTIERDPVGRCEWRFRCRTLRSRGAEQPCRALRLRLRCCYSR